MPIQEVIQCACGCGEALNKFDKYGRARSMVHVHNTKGKSMSPEQRTKIGLANKGNTGCGWSKGMGHSEEYVNPARNSNAVRRLHTELKSESNWTCAKCGDSYPLSRYIHVNHIDGNTSNNDKANLEVLCCHCHIGGHKKAQKRRKDVSDI